MNGKNVLKIILCILFISSAVQTIILAQEKRDESQLGKAVEELSAELTSSLNLSESQQDRLKGILTDFQSDLKGTDRGKSPEEDLTNEARQDKTDVKGENNRDLSGDDGVDVNTGTARTKNETDENNMTGKGNQGAVSFERARIDADSRIEDLLTPEQAIQYGKIKSDWWDKVREKIRPDDLNK